MQGNLSHGPRGKIATRTSVPHEPICTKLKKGRIWTKDFQVRKLGRCRDKEKDRAVASVPASSTSKVLVGAQAPDDYLDAHRVQKSDAGVGIGLLVGGG